jgi:hypothetical protein
MTPGDPESSGLRLGAHVEARMFRRAAALSFTVLVLVGCSGQTSTPTPAASAGIAPVATAAPSPTPVDVGSLFLPRLAAVTRATLDVMPVARRTSAP